ncbi:MAG: hypothetical protein Q7K57_55315 [Burkholderiaceae bacterium]|nr:hypothetical protein [Polaromonas sp.]MDO8777744.1 hypothetical protein [Burkholderiaceae bacterium]
MNSPFPANKLQRTSNAFRLADCAKILKGIGINKIETGNRKSPPASLDISTVPSHEL